MFERLCKWIKLLFVFSVIVNAICAVFVRQINCEHSCPNGISSSAITNNENNISCASLRLLIYLKIIFIWNINPFLWIRFQEFVKKTWTEWELTTTSTYIAYANFALRKCLYMSACACGLCLVYLCGKLRKFPSFPFWGRIAIDRVQSIYKRGVPDWGSWRDICTILRSISLECQLAYCALFCRQ